VHIDWDRIENFIGYGNINAPVVFIGMEESLDKDVPLADDLRMRSQYDNVVDLRAAGEASIRQFQQTWRPLCDLMLRRCGKASSYESRLSYQIEELGHKDGKTLIAELLPYPRKNRRDPNDWQPYEAFDRGSYESYKSRVLPGRIERLKSVLAQGERELIVCHGKAERLAFEALFDDPDWRSDSGFECCVWKGVHVLLVSQLSTKTFNSDEQLQRFADVAMQRDHDHEAGGRV
jgi:hypothetical protein